MTTPSIAAEKNEREAEEAGEVFVVRHVANAEDENARPTNVTITSITAVERIEHPADAQRLFAESEPGEIVEGAPSRVLGASARRP